MRIIYQKLLIKNGNSKPFEFIPKKWLTEWMESYGDDKVSPIDNQIALCKHHKLDFKALSHVKCVRTEGVSEF